MLSAKRLFSRPQRMVKMMNDIDKPTGWWVRTLGGYTIGWLVSKTDVCTTLAPVVTKSGKTFFEVHTFVPGVIIEEGPVMLGRQLTREEYEAHPRNLAQIARESKPILDDLKTLSLDALDEAIDAVDNPTHIFLLGEDQEGK